MQTNASFPFWICHMSPMTRQTCSMLGCSWARTWNQNHTSGKALLVLLHLQCCLSSPFITFDNYQGQRGTLPARETAVLRLLAFSFLFLFRQAQSFLSGLYSEHGARSLCLSKVKGFIGFAVFLERGGKGVAFVISHNSLSFCGTTRVMAPISSRVQYYHSISYPPSHPSPTPPPALSLSQHREDNITPPTSQPPPPPNCAVRQGRGVSREGGGGGGEEWCVRLGRLTADLSVMCLSLPLHSLLLWDRVSSPPASSGPPAGKQFFVSHRNRGTDLDQNVWLQSENKVALSVRVLQSQLREDRKGWFLHFWSKLWERCQRNLTLQLTPSITY